MATAIVATGLINDARKRHKTGGAETIGLGEALMGGLLLASTCKPGERVSLSVRGDKFLRQVMVDGYPNGTVRGFIISRDNFGDIDVEQGPWQHGLLSVARLKVHEKEPYVGTVPILTGFLAKDLTFYLTQSEQIPSSVGLTVNVDRTGKIVSAGAFLVQVMPGATAEEIALVENNINHMQSLAEQVALDPNPTKILAQILGDLTFTILEEKALFFTCNCSKVRISRALKLLGRLELQDMIAKDKGAEVHCDFCAKNYHFDETDLKQLMDEI